MKYNDVIDSKLYYFSNLLTHQCLDFMINQTCTSQEVLCLIFQAVTPHCTVLTNISNILKDYVKDENSAKIFTTFSNYIRNVPIQDDQIMVSFDVTSLYTNIPRINTLNITKDYVHNDDQFTRKMTIYQDKFLDLINLVLTTTGALSILSFTNKIMALQWQVQYLQPQQNFISRLMNILDGICR